MTKLRLIIFFMLILVSCKAPTKTFVTADSNKIGIKGHRFRGTIFKSSYPQENLSINPKNYVNRFTPTINEIELAELILQQQISKANRNRVNQFGKKDHIDRNLGKYFRQYIGFINEKGHRVIHINFYWDKFSFIYKIKGYTDHRLSYESEFTSTYDGGSHYWNINVDLTSKTLYNLSVNGVV